MEINKLIDALRVCADDDIICPACERYDKIGVMGGTADCVSKLLLEAAAGLETQQKRIAELEEQQRWIPVVERLPEPETEVLILATRKAWSYKEKGELTYHLVLTGMHEDGSITTEDSSWCWYDHDFEYDEERDTYIIPEGWWEYKHYNGDDEHNHTIDDFVTHWMPLPEPPKGE